MVTYTVFTKTRNGLLTQDNYPHLNKRRAIITATQLKQFTSNQIFISFFRDSDGQTGFLNPDGSHTITGTSW
jgi:hypothetical protein